MSLRVPAAFGVAISLIILPVILVRAQAEGDTEVPADVVATEPATIDAGPTPEETGPPASEQEGSVLGAETEGDGEPTVGDSDAGAGTETLPAISAASTTPTEFVTTDTASSTASSTEPVADAPVEEPTPIDEPFVLQPAVTLHQSGNSITADIELENLTCKSCEKVLPAAQVEAYYTGWYPNDGEVKEVGGRVGEQAIEVSDVALWSTRSMTWSASDIAPGRYYFVIVVDPDNAIGAYRMHRSEFSI